MLTDSRIAGDACPRKLRPTYRRRPSSAIREALDQRFLDLAADGHSIRAIARLTGQSRFVVKYALRRLTMAPGGPIGDEIEELAEEPTETAASAPADDVRETPYFDGPHRRCPSCGGFVQLPCLACSVRTELCKSAIAAACLGFAFAAILCFASQAPAASFRTANFIVQAESEETAHAVATASETWRVEHAREWLGRELAPWPEPCLVTARVDDSAGGGATSFLFTPAGPRSISGAWQGRREKLLADVTPHEVLHTVLATHFGRPLPRWLDEGACSSVETVETRQMLASLNVEHLQSGRGIAFNRLFALHEYPPDVGAFYAQSHSLTTFLLRHESGSPGAVGESESTGGRRQFVRFVELGLPAGDWPGAVRAVYGYRSLSELQLTWLAWVRRALGRSNSPCRQNADGSWTCPPAAPATPSFPGPLSAPGAADSSSNSIGREELREILRELLAEQKAEDRGQKSEVGGQKTPTRHASGSAKQQASKGDPWWLDALPYAAVAAAGLFGFGIPWYVVAAWKGYRVVRKLRPRRRRSPAASTPPEASEAATRRRDEDFRDPAGVFDRDLGEAQEYLRLAQAEGHAPLQDALVGRIALEELEHAIDGGDAALAQLAGRLKAQIRERVDRLAPVS